jgi:hypothetical protein
LMSPALVSLWSIFRCLIGWIQGCSLEAWSFKRYSIASIPQESHCFSPEPACCSAFIWSGSVENNFSFKAIFTSHTYQHDRDQRPSWSPSVPGQSLCHDGSGQHCCHELDDGPLIACKLPSFRCAVLPKHSTHLLLRCTIRFECCLKQSKHRFSTWPYAQYARASCACWGFSWCVPDAVWDWATRVTDTWSSFAQASGGSSSWFPFSVHFRLFPFAHTWDSSFYSHSSRWPCRVTRTCYLLVNDIAFRASACCMLAPLDLLKVRDDFVGSLQSVPMPFLRKFR